MRWNCWKTKPILSARKRSSSPGGHAGDVDVVDFEFTAGGAVEAAEEVDEGGFAGAGGAGDGDPLAGDDGEGGGVEGADGAGVSGVLAGDACERAMTAHSARVSWATMWLVVSVRLKVPLPPPYFKYQSLQTRDLTEGVHLGSR